jgi:hypothetical protein
MVARLPGDTSVVLGDAIRLGFEIADALFSIQKAVPGCVPFNVRNTAEV